jgi:hypothetical protein
LEGIGNQKDVDQVVLGDRDAAKAEPVDQLRLGEHVGIEAVAAVVRIPVVSPQEVVELHLAPAFSAHLRCQDRSIPKSEIFWAFNISNYGL